MGSARRCLPSLPPRNEETAPAVTRQRISPLAPSPCPASPGGGICPHAGEWGRVLALDMAGQRGRLLLPLLLLSLAVPDLALGKG